MSTCPRETCETTFLYDDVKKVCNNQPCVEGCKPKACPNGLIFNNDRDFKCILEVDCEVPCKEIDGKMYTEGEQIKDYSVVNICQTCHCTRGSIVCTGKPCPTELHCDSTAWSEWMNSPSNPSGDYERLDDPRLQKIYYKMCSLDYISEIECRTTFSRLPVEYSGQKAVCETPVGLICDNADQQDGQCADFEIRVFCNCGFTTVPTTTTGILGAECLVPGWTQWMPTNVLTPQEGEIISELRKYYVFCPDEEIVEVDCRITASKKHPDSGRNFKCTKRGMQCHQGVKGNKCPDYEIRFYCRCKEVECAYPRGIETNLIRNSQITTSSVLSFGETEGYYARLNGDKAWTPKTDSRNEWIQVDVGEIQQLTGIITQGNPNAPEWVEKYKVYYSVDNLAYEDIYDSNRQGVIFEGNSDQNTPVKNYFPSPVRARYIRVYPYTWHGVVSLRLELLGCNVHVTVVTEMITETPLPCVPGWTEYFNTDSPNDGDGDEENVKNIVNTYGVCFGGEITDIECKALIDGKEVSHKDTGDFGVTCKKSVGSFCSNFLQTGKQCEDYMIRLYCTCEVPTIPPTCEWSQWINIDKPRSFKTDAGDIESIEKLQQYYGVCQKPYLKDIECRVAQTKEDWKLSPQNELKCDIDVGFACYNRLQPADCFDYEVRFYCFYDWCLETTTVFITPPVPPTTSPCPPGQYYDECAYTCNKTCSDYLYKLHQIGKCQTGDHCIATCRPYESCEYPLLWKDPYTCVEISKCGCVTPNGNIIEPGEVVYMDCEQCQCFDSIVSCQIAPECTRSPPVGNQTRITEPATITTQSSEFIFVTTPQALLCPEEMVMKHFNISDSQITVSSQGLLSGKDRIRLNTLSSYDGKGGWSPIVSDENQYVEIEFYSPQYVSAIVTQGEDGIDNWVTKYSVSYSDDGELWYDIKQGDQRKIFNGNYDSDTLVTNYLGNLLRTQYIRIIPIQWHKWIAMRLDLKGCFPSSELTTALTEILGNASTIPPPKRECIKEMIFPTVEGIPRGKVSVSSAESEFSGGDRIGIDTRSGPEGTGGWKAALNDKYPYVLIDFQEVRNLSAVAIQGQEDEDNWVTKFEVKYSIDDVVWKDAIHVTDGREFKGNNDRNTRALRWFDRIIAARYIKIIPRASHGTFAMRLEVLGCYEIIGEERTETVPPTLPTAVYCPELPYTLKGKCPHCSPGSVCDGSGCIDSEDCPCYMEGKMHLPGSMFETSDCHECTCVMHGRSSCVKKECEFCAEGYTAILTSDCRCKCQKCEDGTRYCPSDGQCIDKAKWCDGNVDCVDDEIYCASTATTPFILTFPPTTIPPSVCVPSLNDESAVCRLNSIYLETFDGQYYQADVCDHVLFRETHFQLYSVKIHKECFTDSGYCRKYINIDVDGFNIRIGPGSERVLFGGVEVPKTKFELLSKRYKEFILRSEGTSLHFISPKYGFEVIWGAQDNVEVKVSDCQLHQVDGLCGFYDGIKENDFQKPDGSIADTVESFTKSWSIGPSDRCIEFACDYHTKLAADRICASIENPIFEDCNQVLDMRRQSEMCVTSACECLAYNYTTPDCTCQILENFILTCKEKAKGAVEDSWRVDFSCAPKCPPGFIWEDCGPSCELTCESFQGLSRNVACPKRCNPGCFCPSGLVRKDDKCVDAKLCHDCICEGFGDPNYETFDKVSYSFQGNCTYVLVHHDSDSLRNLEVYATNTECPEEPGTTCTTGLKIIHNKNEITITRNQPVEFNGRVLEDVFYNFYEDGVNLTATKQHVMVYIEEIHFLAHYIAPNFGYIIRMPSKLYYNKTAGLCGICNFDKTDDLYHRDGYISDDIADFAYSWLVNGSREKCTLTEVPVKPVDNDTCKFEKNECEMYVDPAPYIKACLNDVGYSHNLKHSVCNTVLQYASSCCGHGVILDDWIESYGCDIPCSDGMQFQCKSPCHLTCSNYKDNPSDCSIPPEYICSCPGKQVVKNGECVDPIYCEACDDEGHEVGDRWNVDLCQSCECLPNSKVICQNTVCPTMPSCPEGTSLEIVDNGTCCDQYICKQKPTECPPPVVPTCEVGALPQLLSKEYGCPEYECVCEISLCPPLRNISLLEPGEEEFFVQNGCCLDQEVRCVPENCPPSLPCPIGSKKVETKGKCCDVAECLQEQCVYNHLFDVVEGFENETLPKGKDQRLYSVGETWKDGLCLTCECYNESGQIIHSCKNEICDVPNYVKNQEDYLYEEVVVPGMCCPEYIRSACQSNGTVYKVGEEWPSPYGEKCTSYKCVEGATGEIEKVKTVLTCNKTCAAHSRYREPPSEAPECCGYCEQFACEDDGKIYEVGQTWIPRLEKCITAECVMIGDKIEKKLTGKQCPLIPMNCPEEHKIMDESGCCELCRIIPGACEVKEIPKRESVHYFFLYDKAKGGCFNKEPLEGLTECSGNCHSENTYSSSLDLFKTVCNCCVPRGYVERPITLLCEDNSTLVKFYRQPQTCDCTSCLEEQQSEPQPTIPQPVIV